MTLTEIAPLLNTVGLGLVAYILLVHVRSDLRSVERSVNRLTRVWALSLVTDPRTTPAARREAEQVVKEIESERHQ